MKFILALVTVLFLGVACTRPSLKKREESLRKATSEPELIDDLPLSTLSEGLRREANVLKAKPDTANVTFGKTVIQAKRYAAALEYVAKLADLGADKSAFLQALKKDFDFYEVYGSNDWSKVLLTSYYEPEVKGSLKKTPQFSQPLYKTPPDLVDVAFPKNDERFADLGQMRGRLSPEKTVRGTLQLVPYYSREEIDEKGVLKNRGLELCYLDPVEAFFLQIQGSGTVTLENGTPFRVGYADQNGQPYQAIGRYILDAVPLDKMTMQALEAHLRSLPEAKMRSILSRNPSYVFFEKREGAALTSVGTPVVNGRTIATDARFFPKGTLAFLKFEKPVFANPSDTAPMGWENSARLVLDQDTGGAIKGGGRVDLFWGTGSTAKQSAGVIKQTGELYYLVPKEELLSRLQ